MKSDKNASSKSVINIINPELGCPEPDAMWVSGYSGISSFFFLINPLNVNFKSILVVFVALEWARSQNLPPIDQIL